MSLRTQLSDIFHERTNYDFIGPTKKWFALSGTVILIGATTENPSFEVISPLLSRSLVVVLQPLSEDALLGMRQKRF